jgi:hypothetical protein
MRFSNQNIVCLSPKRTNGEQKVDLQENLTSLVYHMKRARVEPDSMYKKLVL